MLSELACQTTQVLKKLPGRVGMTNNNRTQTGRWASFVFARVIDVIVVSVNGLVMRLQLQAITVNPGPNRD